MHHLSITASRFRRLVECSVLVSSFLLSLSAVAATSVEIEDTIVVSAHRIPVAQEAAGSSVSTADRTLIDQRQTVFLTDLLQTMPGTAVSRTAAAGSQSQVRIRGAEANQVLVIIDGVEANDPAGNDEFDFSALTSYDVDHIELVRGPQSALWGSDAGAGVINITTRTGTAPFSGGAFLEGGSFGTGYGGARVAASGTRGSVAAGVSYYDSTGESAAAAGDEKDGYENLTLTFNSHLDATENVRLGFSARHRESTSEYDDYDFTTGLPADADVESDDSLLLLGADAKIDLFDNRWQQHLKLTWLDSEREQYTDGVADSSSTAEKLGIYYQSTLRLGERTDGNDQQLIFALDHEREEFSQRGAASFFGDPNQDQDLDNTGYIAEYLIRPLAGLHLSASIRHDDNSDFDDITTYRLTSSYLIDATDSRVHASWGTGQKSPTFIERFGFFPDQFLGNPELEPEKTQGFDLGIEQSLFAGRASIDLTWFNEQLEDEIDGFVFDPNTFLFTAGNLDGESHREGVEVEFKSRLNSTFDARFSYTYVDSSQPDSGGGSSREIRRPRHTAAMNLNQTLFDARGNLNLNLTYTGEQLDQFFPPPTYSATTQKLDGYLLLDLALSYSLTERITVYSRATNLFDEDYRNVIGFQSPGRAVYAGIRMDMSR